MSGLIDQAGLTAGAGLSNGAGLYKYANFNPFDPTDLDPYLLFDTAAGSMIGTLENPTLDLDPTNQETLDVITATRSSVATRTLADGRIALAEQDTVRVDYTQGEQLTPTKYQQLEQTDFSLWAHARTSGTANAAISPDGQNNATYVEQNAGQTNAGSIYRFDAAVTGVFTLSVYAKKKEKDFVVLYDSNTNRTYFNLDTGTVGTVPSGNTANIEDAGNGWFRCSTTFTASSGGVKAFYVGDNDNSLTVTDGGGIYVWGPQLEEGTTASSFVANTTGSPLWIASPTFGPRVPMILVEPSAENLVTYSEDFSNSYWYKSDVTVASAPVAAPDGTMTASHVVKTGSDGHLAKSSIGAANSHKTSIWARTVSGSGTCFFNYHSGTPSTVTDQWQRFEVTSNTAHIYPVNFRGTSTLTEIYIWGAQLETGSVATSYIPTSGGDAAARTRASDDLQIERDSTNLVTDSANFSGSSITVTKIGSNFEAPDGSLTASKFSGITNAVGDRIYTLYTGVSSSTQITGSVYLKGTAGEVALIQHKRISGGTYAASSQISLTLDGTWQRVATGLTYTTAADTTHSVITIRHDSAGTADELLVWGAQIEEGSEATSLIPTSGAAASRTTFSDFYNQSEGTIYTEFVPSGVTDNHNVFQFDQSAGNRIVGSIAGGPVLFQSEVSSVDEATLNLGSIAANQLSRLAGSFKLNNVKASVNGGSELSDTSVAIPSSMVLLNIGQRSPNNRTLNGHIKRLIFWPTHSDSL